MQLGLVSSEVRFAKVSVRLDSAANGLFVGAGYVIKGQAALARRQESEISVKRHCAPPQSNGIRQCLLTQIRCSMAAVR